MVMATDPQASGGARSAMSFLLKRLTRIYPLYWLATLINIAILLAMPKVVLHSSFEMNDIVRWFLLIPTENSDGRIEPLVGVGWTLYFEMAFYIIFSIIIFLKISPTYLIPFLFVFGLFGFYFPYERDPFLIYFSPLLFEFAYGVIIAWLAKQGRIPSRGGGVMIVVGMATLLLAPARLGNLDVVMHGISAAVIVLGFVALEPFWAKHDSRTLLFLGAASYAMYLFHPIFGPAVPVVLSVLKLKLGLFSIVAIVVGNIAAGALIHKFLEIPLLALLNGRIRKAFG